MSAVWLSPHFTLASMLRSETAARKGIDNTPSEQIIRNLRRLCTKVLEPIRVHIDKPVFVSSGYRSPALNRAVKGSKKSDHMLGYGADIDVADMTVDELVAKIREIEDQIPLKQCIDEFGAWVHVSCTAEGDDPKREFLLARRVGTETIYTRVA